MAFVCKQTAVLVVPSITLDNSNAVLQTCRHISHLILYHIPQLALLDVFLCFFQF